MPIQLPTDPERLTQEVLRLRRELNDIYDLAGSKLWKSRQRSDTAGHHCDYRGALQAVKARIKKALATTGV